MFDRCFGCMQPLAFSDAPCPHCGYDGRAKQFDRNHLPPGTVLQKRYVLGAALGLGGFGNTYIGWDPMTQMRVTVKEYLPSAFAHHRADSPAVQCDSDEARALFEKGLRDYCAQAAALRRLPSTECVNPILDVVRENGTAYTVMEYLSGKTLKAYLSEYRAMSFLQAMDVMAPILRTLDTVHKNGLLHRDICPDNIFLCRNGQVRILDFGLAQYDLMPDSSESLSVLFKPGFAPPEQYMRHLLAGPWTDVYGAAATLYKMITGIAPPDVPQRQRGDTLLAPHELGCDMPQSAEHALLRALSLRPEDRYATAEVFLRALTEDDPQDEDDADESKSDALRKILRIAAVAAVIIAVCIGAAAWITHRPKTDPDRTNDPTQITAVTENDETIGANVVYFDGFQPSAVEVLRTQNGDAAALPYVVFTRDGRRGLVSQTGETLLPAQYNTIVWDTETQSFLLDGSTHRSLTGEPAPQSADETQAGDPEKQPSYALAYTYEGDALYRTAGGEKLAQGSATGGFLVCTGDKYGIVTGGTVLVEPLYEKATALCCGIAAFLEDDKWTYRNQYGIDILGQSFDASVFPNGIPFSYSDGFVPIYDAESGLWGYADTAGQMRVEPQFLTALPPVQSVAWVQTKDGFGVIRFGGENGTITGKCGENAQYTFTPGTGLLEIDGFGEMWNFTAENVPWLSEMHSIRTVRVAGDVDYIGAGSFTGCTALTGVTVTGSLRGVGTLAFAGCSALRMFAVSATIEEIGESAFYRCTGLADIPLQSVQTLGIRSFAQSGIQHAELPLAAIIPQSGFNDCTELQAADLSGTAQIGVSAFSGCTALETVTMPAKMDSIGEQAFADCTALTAVRVPPGVTQIASQTFRNCTALTSITLPDGLKLIAQEAFSGCSALDGVSLPPTLTGIGTRAFGGCARMQSVMVPDSVSTIGSYAFAGCTGITTFELKDTVKTMGVSVFDGWTARQTIRVKNVLIKRLFGEPSGWDSNWKAGCNAQIESA